MTSDEALPAAGLWRRLGALVYDTLLVVALLMAATVPFIPFLHGRVLVPGEVGALAYVYWLWQVVVIALFFGYFWTRRGQTVGMLAWRVRLERGDGSRVGWAQAIKRIALALILLLPFLAGGPIIFSHVSDRPTRILAMSLLLAPAVLAYVCLWFDRERGTLYDRWTGTRVVLLPKR
jgi:uncharacterized RDD family membrane protein YckC